MYDSWWLVGYREPNIYIYIYIYISVYTYLVFAAVFVLTTCEI